MNVYFQVGDLCVSVNALNEDGEDSLLVLSKITELVDSLTSYSSVRINIETDSNLFDEFDVSDDNDYDESEEDQLPDYQDEPQEWSLYNWYNTQPLSENCRTVGQQSPAWPFQASLHAKSEK